MPYKAIRVLVDHEAQSQDVATKVIKLPLSNVLHTLFVKAEATTGTTGYSGAKVADTIDKIEVIGNGSEVLVSLTPDVLRDVIKAKYDYAIQETTSSQPNAALEVIFPIPFGHDFWDPNFWLPCNKFTDLELRITYNLDKTGQDWASGSMKFTVLAYMTMEGMPGAYQGTLRHTIVYDWSTASSGDETITMPRRLLWHGLLLQAIKSGATLKDVVSRVKLSINNDQIVPLNIKPDDYLDAVQKIQVLANSMFIDLRTWVDGGPFNPVRYDIVQLVVTQAASAAAAKVMLEEAYTIA